MQGMKQITKKELHRLIDEQFADKEDNDVIATLFFCSEDHKSQQQQAMLFVKELNI